jgi:GTPase SAR1 family protein
LRVFEISDDAGATVIRWGDVAEISFGSNPEAEWRWLRKPPTSGETIACERQAEVFQQRCCGREVLHGSAVHLPWGILCVCGASGVGKSTLAVALSRHGYEIVADDDILLCEEAGTQRLLPNYLGSRLTKGSADLLGLKEQELSTDFPGSEKRIWPGSSWMPRSISEGETHSIWGIVILEADDGCHTAFERAKDTAAFEVLWRQIKYPWMSLSGWRLRQFGAITSLVRCSAVFRWRRKPAATLPFAMANNLLDILSAEQWDVGSTQRVEGSIA